MIDSNENYPLTIIDLCLAEGTTVLTAQALSGRIEEDWPRLMQLLNQFKPPSSTTTSSTNNSSSESEWIEQFAKTIHADLECVRSVYKSHFHQSSSTAVSPWKFPLFSINQTAVERQQASERLCTAYYAERLASIRCLIRLIASAMQESHWFHSSAIALVERHRQDLIVLFQTSVKQLTAQFSHLSTPGRSQQRQALAQTLREILLLTELIYWLSRWTGTLRTERLDFSSVILPVINQLLSAAFSPKLQFLVTSAGKPMIEESLENWRAVCVFTVAELLQLNRLNYSAIIPVAVLQPRDCIQLAEILQSSLLPPVAQGANSTVPDKLAGLLLLAGASLFSHISDNIPTSASSPDWMELQCNANGPVELFRLLAQKAFQSGVLEALPAMLNSDSGVFCRTDLFTVEPIGESQQAFLVVICRILFWFTRQFDLTQLNGAEDLFAGALNALLRKSPAVRKLIISQRGAEDAHTLRSSWESAAAQFPLSFIRFAQLNECLMLLKTEDSVSDLAIKASAALLNMPTVAQDAQQIDPEHVQHLGDGLVRSSKPLTIGVGPFATLTIPAGTDGQYTTLPSGTVHYTVSHH
jgi:hypothetical protein